jgi:polysaccharide biosynthesis protein PslG
VRALPPLVLVTLLVGCPVEPEPEPEPEPEVVEWMDVAPDLCVARSLTAGSSQLDLSLSILQEMGVTSLRGTIHWDRVEPSPGNFDWSGYEPVVDALAERGIDQLVMLAYGNPWASSDPEADIFYPPDDPADFAAYAGATAEHFAGRTTRYEIWNEQNAGYRFWKPGLDGDPQAYGELFAAAADAVHAADPAATVWIGGTFFHEQFITGAINYLAAMPQEAWDAADGLAFHPYTFYPPAVPPEYAGPSETSLADGEIPLVDMIAELRAVAAAAGRPDLPLAVTEFGWPSWGDVDLAEQADWAERSVLLGLSQGVGTWCGYTIFNREPGAAEDRFGMAEPDGTLTPYGERMQHLATELVGVERAALLPLREGQHGVALQDGEGVERRIYWGAGSVETPDGELLELGTTPIGW